MAPRHKIIDELLKEYQTSEDFFGKDSLLKQLTKDLVERILQAELTDHHRGSRIGLGCFCQDMR